MHVPSPRQSSNRLDRCFRLSENVGRFLTTKVQKIFISTIFPRPVSSRACPNTVQDPETVRPSTQKAVRQVRSSTVPPAPGSIPARLHFGLVGPFPVQTAGRQSGRKTISALCRPPFLRIGEIRGPRPSIIRVGPGSARRTPRPLLFEIPRFDTKDFPRKTAPFEKHFVTCHHKPRPSQP